jgi:hypothetical protein
MVLKEKIKLGLVDKQLLSQLKKSGWKVYFYKFNYYTVNILNTENSQPLPVFSLELSTFFLYWLKNKL